MFMEDPVSRN